MMRLLTSRADLDGMIAGWRGPLLAALIALVAGLPGMLFLPPLDRDESRFAQATTQMLETRDFVNIEFQDQPRHKKPVGIHWLQAVAVSLFSEAEARDIRVYRLPSLLAAMAAAAACAWGAAALFGTRAGFLAGAILGTTFLLSSEAGIAKTDAVLCAAVTLAMAALARLYAASRGELEAGWRSKLLFWAAMGVAILVKGPIGPLTPAFALLVLGFQDRRWRWMRRLGWGWGLMIVAAIVGPWAVAITIATDGAFWGTAVGGDLAPKLFGGHERHFGLPGLYLILTPLLFFPASLLLPAALMVAVRRRTESGVRFATAWLVPTWLMFELAPTKLWHYTLPTFGALAWLAAAAMTQPIGDWSRRVGAAAGLIGAACVAAIVIFALSDIGGGGAAQSWASPTIGLAAVGAAVAGFLLVNRASGSAVLFALVCGVLAHASMVGVARSLEPLWIGPRLATTIDRAGIDPRDGRVAGPVAMAGYSEPSAIFLLGTQTELGDGAMAARAVAEGRPAAVEGRQQASFLAEMARLRIRPYAVGVVEGRNYSNGDETRLTLYRPVPPVTTSAQ